MAGIIFLLIVWVLPIWVSAKLCKDRNRDPWKGAFVGLAAGWIGAILIWLALRKRDINGYLM